MLRLKGTLHIRIRRIESSTICTTQKWETFMSKYRRMCGVSIFLQGRLYQEVWFGRKLADLLAMILLTPNIKKLFVYTRMSLKSALYVLFWVTCHETVPQLPCNNESWEWETWNNPHLRNLIDKISKLSDGWHTTQIWATSDCKQFVFNYLGWQIHI